MNNKIVLACTAVGLLLAPAALAQITIADWTFDVSQPTTPGPISPEVGSGSATAVGLTSITDTAGNPGKSFSGPGWDVGDYWQFQVTTVGFQSISVSYDQEGSGTGPGQFALQYSTDGLNFTQFGDVYSLGTASKWTSHPADLSSISALNNASTVYFRVVDTSATSISGATVGASGTDRIDNFIVTASGTVVTEGAPKIVLNPQSTNAAAGRTVTVAVVASGSEPLSYQWYYPNLSQPLADNGTYSGSTTATLTVNNLTAAQAGNYQVIVTNTFGSVTSSVAALVVNTPVATTIGHLRTLQDPVNWAPTNTTSLYTVTGTVTTYVSMTAAGNTEFYIQDATGGIAVYVTGGTSVPDAGSVVQVTGPLGQYNGLLEMTLGAANPDDSIAVVGNGSLPAPQPFNLSQAANIPYMEATEGSLVVISNVFLDLTSSYFAGSKTVSLTNQAGQVFNLFVNASETDIIGQPIPQFAASITGVLGQYKSGAPYTSGYELDITQYADLVPGTPPPPVTLPIPLNVQVSGNSLILTWSDASFHLQSSTSLAGPYQDIPAAAGLATYTDGMTGPANFYRLMQP